MRGEGHTLYTCPVWTPYATQYSETCTDGRDDIYEIYRIDGNDRVMVRS